jgi:hyperosmotically inducible periplasmic protein
MPRCAGALLLLAFLGCAPHLAAQDEPRAVTEIRRELTDLPQYGIFDLITFEYDRGAVTLAGYVTDSSLKKAAEKAVRKVEGVERVSNRIESLPTGRADQDLRIKLRRAIYEDSPLERYENADESRSAIRILVNHGRVTLAGVVDRLEDKELAELKAKGVFGVREVANQLQTKAQVEAR